MVCQTSHIIKQTLLPFITEGVGRTVGRSGSAVHRYVLLPVLPSCLWEIAEWNYSTTSLFLAPDSQ